MVVAFCFTLYFAFFCHAQSVLLNKNDSLALESRFKADIILSQFDSIPGKRMLYSHLDRDYYIIIQQDNCYKEYSVIVDNNGRFLFINEIENDKELELLQKNKFLFRKNKARLKHIVGSRLILKKAFNTDQYSKGFITSMPNASYIAGIPSYFVIKDEYNQRYGEFSLSSMISPCPIDPLLWLYLNRQLSEIVYARDNHGHY